MAAIRARMHATCWSLWRIMCKALLFLKRSRLICESELPNQLGMSTLHFLQLFQRIISRTHIDSIRFTFHVFHFFFDKIRLSLEKIYQSFCAVSLENFYNKPTQLFQPRQWNQRERCLEHDFFHQIYTCAYKEDNLRSKESMEGIFTPSYSAYCK